MFRYLSVNVLGFATSFIHYVLDRAAFRFSSPDVRQAASGLLK